MINREKVWHYAAYIFWGILTTLVNILVFEACRIVFSFPVPVSNAVAWVLSVLFAFFTNREFVFKGQNGETASLGVQIGLFFLSRLFSGAMDMALVVLLISSLGLPELPMKVLINGVVIIVNYVASALVVFRRRSTPDGK
jgi:putative flippase GtrA